MYFESDTFARDDDSGDDEAAEIRYSLTALGEALVVDRRARFRGFGPCTPARPPGQWGTLVDRPSKRGGRR